MSRDSSTLFFVPMKKPDDVIPHLARKSHWKERRSAYELAHSWFGANGIPERVRRVLDTCPLYRNAEIEFGAFEHTTRLDEFPRASQTDLMLLLLCPNGEARKSRAIVAVEGKVDEPFDLTVGEKRAAAATPSHWPQRIAGLCRRLSIDEDGIEGIGYQLVHRTCAALIEAQRLGAAHAMLLIHSFSEGNIAFSEEKGDRFRDYAEFARILGFKTVTKNNVSDARKVENISLRLAWVVDRPSKP